MRKPAERVLRSSQRILFLAGLLLLGAWTVVQVHAQWFQWHGHRFELYAGDKKIGKETDINSSRSLAILPRSVWGRIEIPRLGLSSVLVEGVDAVSLLSAVGHDPGSRFPGQSGGVVLAGHRDTYFRKLQEIRPGDKIRIATAYGIYVYEVLATEIVAPNRIDLPSIAQAAALTLITCYPFHYIGPAPLRFLVKARLFLPPAYAAPPHESAGRTVAISA